MKVYLIFLIVGFMVCFSTAFSEEVKQIPDEAYRLTNDGKRYFDNGQYDKAIELLTKAVQIAPRYADAYNNLATAYIGNGEYNKAISFAKKEAEVYSVLGNAYLKKDMLDEAIAAYKKALELNPSLQGARNNLRTAEERKRLMR